MNLLVVNAGSSSLKLRVLDADDNLLEAEDLPAVGGAFDPAALRRFLTERTGPIAAVGHRIVHGGSRFVGPAWLDAATTEALDGLVSLAPLHQAACLRAVDIVGKVLHDVPAVGCFDTAFHSSLPDAAAIYAVPLEWRERFGVRRFGFHGLSHAYAWRRTIELMGHSGTGVRVVTCHLGAGASLAAIFEGRSVDTTMGFTPLEGLVMATRSGTIDPGLILWLAQEHGMAVGDIAHALEHESGLYALAGSSDMEEIEALAADGDATARLALDVYVHRLRAAIAGMASALDGVDAVTFTGGVGENAARLRAEVISKMGYLRLSLDDETNSVATPDIEITGPRSRVRVFVVQAREDLQIAAEVRSFLLREKPDGWR
jgi:acetate kinase